MTIEDSRLSYELAIGNRQSAIVTRFLTDMVDGLIGVKAGMTQVFGEDGKVIPATVIKTGPCIVVQKKGKEKDGYDAVQLGLVEFIRPSRVKKPRAGHFKKADVPPQLIHCFLIWRLDICLHNTIIVSHNQMDVKRQAAFPRYKLQLNK